MVRRQIPIHLPRIIQRSSVQIDGAQVEIRESKRSMPVRVHIRRIEPAVEKEPVFDDESTQIAAEIIRPNPSIRVVLLTVMLLASGRSASNLCGWK